MSEPYDRVDGEDLDDDEGPMEMWLCPECAVGEGPPSSFTSKEGHCSDCLKVAMLRMYLI